MQKIKYILPILLITVGLFIIPVTALADGPQDPGPDPVPLDGGVTALVAAGVGYGLKKMKKRRADKKKTVNIQSL
jgi:hypothetical protein